MKTLILCTFLFLSLFSFQTNAQNQISNKDIIEVETIVKKSQQKYDEAKKKVYRAEEKLNHLRKIGVLSYSEVMEKEQLLKKANNKLEQMRLLLKHNTTLISQTKSNPSFRKSIRSRTANSNPKNQQKTMQDIHQEQIEKIRKQQKQTLVNKVKENRNKMKQQQADSAPKSAQPTKKNIAKPKKKVSKNKNQ